jgi:hypothetical protein
MKLAASLLAVLVMGASCGPSRQPVRSASADPLEVIPADWLHLPDAPFVARILRGKAVLVNRTSRWFDNLSSGCVIQRGNSAHVVGTLFGHRVFDSAWGPGDSVEGVLRMINNIDFYVAGYAVTRCPAGSRTAVTSASGTGNHWTAEGTSWPR